MVTCKLTKLLTIPMPVDNSINVLMILMIMTEETEEMMIWVLVLNWYGDEY